MSQNALNFTGGPPSFERTLWALRDAGWAVAIHNDYWQNGTRRTFWLFTHRRGIWIKGEGDTDMDALMECDAQARAWDQVDI